jgi:uncharacterized protein (TIGR01777 family)
MRIALTGATGFVGRHLVQAAIRRGFEVVAFTRNPSRIVRDCVETRLFSLDAPPDLRECDAVIHLAGENVVGIWTAAKKRRILESRVLGTGRLVEAIRALGTPPEVLVSASAVGYYGDGGEAELTELAPPGNSNDFRAKVCADWEKAAAPAAGQCRVVLPRIAIVLGRDGGMLKVTRRIFRLGLGGRLGHGRQWLPWIHVDDLVALLLFAVENMDIRGAVNAASPWPVRNADFTRALARAVHRPAIFPVPAFLLRLIFLGFAQGLLASQRVVPAAAMDHGFSFKFPEVEPALRDAVQ